MLTEVGKKWQCLAHTDFVPRHSQLVCTMTHGLHGIAWYVGSCDLSVSHDNCRRGRGGQGPSKLSGARATRASAEWTRTHGG